MVKPKKNIKKLDTFNDTKKIVLQQESRRQYRFLLDLGVYGQHFVNCEIPMMSNQRARRVYQSPYINELYNCRPIRVIYRSSFSDNNINEFLGSQTHPGGRKIDISLEQLDPTGVRVSQWLLRGCHLTEIFTEMDYDGESTIEFTINMEHFVLQF